MPSVRTRVLLLIPSLVGGGAERFFCILSQYLDRSRFEPHLALFSVRGEYLPDIPKDVGIHDLGCSRARYAIPSIARLVRKLRPQTVLSTLASSNLALMLAKPLLPRGTKLLLSEDCHTSSFLKEGLITQPRVWAFLYRRLYKHADKIICLSQSMADDLVVNYNVPREKVASIYYPVDVERVQRLSEASSNPYSASGPQLVAVGRLARQKGFDLLLAAMPAVRDEFPGVKLAVLGQGSLQGELTDQAQRLGLSDLVTFYGFQQNPWPYIRHADVFVMSSRFEGLPNVLLEAMALQKPIVAANCPGGISELQSLASELQLVPPENPAALAKAIISACCAVNGNRNGHASGTTYPMAMFSVQHVVEQYSQLMLPN